MSIYPLRAQIICRGEGGNAVAGAAYRSASRLTDEASGIIHDFRCKRGVAHTEIMGPPNAPEWIYDRQILWNAVESIERRRDAQLAREVEIALPVEMSLDDHIELIHRYVRCEFVAAGWNETENLIGWFLGWADLVNAFLAKIGVARLVDHRSLDVQGIARSPPRR